MVSQPESYQINIPETLSSADEEDNNYYEGFSASFEDDEVFNNISQEVAATEKENNSTINLNELSSCLEKIQNTEDNFGEVDYSNLFATVDVANDVDIDKLINSHDYDRDEFVPFEYVKKLMFEEAPSTNSMICNGDFNQSVEQFSYGML